MNNISIKKSLNKTWFKVPIYRQELERFITNFDAMLSQVNLDESEEFHKNLITRFLNDTYYHPDHYINTKGKNDLVIHLGKNAKTNVGVIIETKKPSHKFVGANGNSPLSDKAFQELLLYFLRERITHKNLEIKHLIVTNVYQWFIFDANEFERLFVNNKNLIQQFNDFEAGKLSGKTTDFFYQEIAKPAIAAVENQIVFTYFQTSELSKNSEVSNQEKDLIAFYKIFSPQHLLKLPFANDSNSLDKNFYNELLYIIGLTEVKQGGKKVIEREKEEKRHRGSLLENIISQLKSLERLSRLEDLDQFGETEGDQLFNIGLELVITWINRILFLKLLEAQLIRYHQGDKDYAFLNSDKIKNYDDLNSLFFEVLACKPEDREEDVREIFANIPYLNSSLFDQTDLEHNTLFISNLKDRKLPIFTATVLKDRQGKKLTGELDSLEYLFKFLDSYDFGESPLGSRGDLIKNDQKRLITASVLGLIFEKINGYKDGSFFTPGFITMYMCRETIRRAIIQKFNGVKGWNCQTLEELYNKIEDKREANQIINSLKICDPAVGSGHFLVSALNEIITIKSKLKILLDKEGKTLRDYQITVENDELIIIDDDGNFFEYNPKNQESQRIQETLFQEKQTIIENCLFGVDINPNSVKICRLRLWIELLKNAYYKTFLDSPFRGNDNYRELETLPNIDINIKHGNSLISRFPLDADLKTALRKSQSSLEDYRQAVKTYLNAEDKQQKRMLLKLIRDIKANFTTVLQGQDQKKTRLRNLEGELYQLENQTSLLVETEKERKAREKKINKLLKEIDQLTMEIEEIESGKIYQNAFEWRFEFPELLDQEGNFIGFDVIIGNPPYGVNLSNNEKQYFQQNFTHQDYQLDTYLLFIEKAFMIMKIQGEFSFIIPNTWLSNLKFKKIRLFIINNTKIYTIAHYQKAVFEDAVVDTHALFFAKSSNLNETIAIRIYDNNQNFTTHFNSQYQWKLLETETINIFLTNEQILLKNKIEFNSYKLDSLFNIVIGLKPYQKGKGKPKQTESDVKNRVFDASYQVDKTYRKILRGSDINRYFLQWKSGLWLKYGDNLAEPRYSANFDADEKIVIRQTGDSLIATIDNQQFICMNNLHVITQNNDNSLSLKYLLALLNSKLLDYYHYLINPEKGEALAEIKKENVAKLPIKIISDLQQKPLIELVTKILEIKQSNPHADTSQLEKEIDLLVYELYGLTESEIKIVEST